MSEQDELRGTRGGQVPNLTTEQHNAATYGCAVADDLLKALDKGKRTFTAYGIGCKHDDLTPLVECGVLTKHKSGEHDGFYYRANHLTRQWCLTSLALRDERVHNLKARTTDGQRNG